MQSTLPSQSPMPTACTATSPPRVSRSVARVIHLWPSRVVARVTSGAPGVNPHDVERELDVARHAARACARGRTAERPAATLPHRRDGHTLVFWHYLVKGHLAPAGAGQGLRANPRLARGLRRPTPPRWTGRGSTRNARALRASQMISNFCANSLRARNLQGRRCTATPTSSTACKPRPGRSRPTRKMGPPRPPRIRPRRAPPARALARSTAGGSDGCRRLRALRRRPPWARAPGVRLLGGGIVHGRGRPPPRRRTSTRAPAAVSTTLPPLTRHLRGLREHSRR